jgi:hypothetical protein
MVSWFPNDKASSQNMKKYGSLSLGKTGSSGVTAVVHRSSAAQRPLQFRVRRRSKHHDLLSFHVYPPLQNGTDTVLALLAYGMPKGSNITSYDVALVDNPRKFNVSKSGATAFHWNEWVLENYSLKPGLVNTTGIWRAYDDLGLKAKAPFSTLQQIDPEAVQIYYDTSKFITRFFKYSRN